MEFNHLNTTKLFIFAYITVLGVIYKYPQTISTTRLSKTSLLTNSAEAKNNLTASTVITASALANALDFERQANGDTLIAGMDTISIIQPYKNLFRPNFGFQFTTNRPNIRPLNLYNSELVGGEDDDLERNSKNTGLYAGGNLPAGILHNLLIINEDDDIDVPDDYGPGGQIIVNSDTMLFSFGFDFVDLDANKVQSSTITFANTETGNSTQITFATLEDGSGSIYEQTGVEFGDRFANRVQDITAEQLGLTSFNRVTFTLTGSGGIGTLYFLPVALDFGDLPDGAAGTNNGNYETLSENNGPSHQIIEGLLLGSQVDAEKNGAASNLADGDNNTKLNDEDAIQLLANAELYPNNTIRLPFSATNTTSDTAFVKAWIDWNNDGDFEDNNEVISDFHDQNTNTFPAFINFTVPPNAAQNTPLGFRVRMSQTADMMPNGYLSAGEVEDYLVTIACPQTVCLPISAEKI